MNTEKCNAETELFCIFGRPVRHSLSPAMHNAAFAAAGINAVYLAFSPSSIDAAVSAMKALGIRGASVTIPFKTEVIASCDVLDASAAAIGSVNTLINRQGIITGYSTDGDGAVMALDHVGITPSGAKFLVIGNGGSARAIAYSLLAAGGRVIIAGRNPERARACADDLAAMFTAVDAICIPELTPSFMKGIDVVINTTPVGMEPATEASPIPADLLESRHTVFDIVYAPHRTRLLEEALARGCAVVFGIDMLIFQGAKQFELWTGRPAPIDAMREAAMAHLRGRHD